MPRNISFAMTTEQVRQRTKTVTRRLGWLSLKEGEVLNAVNKCMGFKKGEKPERLAVIRAVNVRREPLDTITKEDVVKEGFPEMSVAEFVEFFCKSHKGCESKTKITRIEFEYLDNIGG